MISQDVLYFPLFFNLTEFPCLVVGGGTVALRKVEQLLKAGANVTIVAPQIIEDLNKLLQPEKCVWVNRRYKSPEAASYRLVVATTDDSGINQQIFEDCQARGIPVNVVDQPHLCTVIFPSIIQRGMITLAVSSSGKAPFLTKALKERLESFMAEIYHLEKPDLLIKFRDFVKSKTDNLEVKKRLYHRLLSCDKELWSQWSETEPPYDLWLNWLNEEDV